MESNLTKVINSVQQSIVAFAKYVTANDTGATGSHQTGFHIHKSSWSLFLDQPAVKGQNITKNVEIKWQDNFLTTSNFKYYGTGTRDEYLLTKFGRGFPFLQDENIGDLLIICKISSDYYTAYILNTDEDIDNFLAALNISTTNINGIIPKQFEQSAGDILLNCFISYINSVKVDFPTTIDLATHARNCFINAHNKTKNDIITNPDKELINWLNSEFQLFKVFENNRYSTRIQTPFSTVEELIVTANTILNRRKSRAGKSLEHHLSEIFRTFELNFASQATTEDNKRPDFIFPNIESYNNANFNNEKLLVLASKTTCKDRWRQILNEADHIKIKHLFTLQQGISKNQLVEMYNNNVRLVVPKPYLDCFPHEFRDKILTLDKFVNKVRQIQIDI
jgi:type II restriction enzyme